MSIAIDGTPVHANPGAVSSTTLTLSTTLSPDVIIFYVAANGGPVLSIAPTNAGNFSTQPTFRKTAGGSPFVVEEWYAITNAALSGEVFTITQTSSAALLVDGFAVSGANTSSPFDGSGFTAASGNVTGVSTSNANNMLINGSREGPAGTHTAGNFGANAGTLLFGPNFSFSQYCIVSATQSSITVTQTPDDGNQNGGIVDAIKQATSAVADQTGMSQGFLFHPGAGPTWQLQGRGAYPDAVVIPPPLPLPIGMLPAYLFRPGSGPARGVFNPRGFAFPDSIDGGSGLPQSPAFIADFGRMMGR